LNKSPPNTGGYPWLQNHRNLHVLSTSNRIQSLFGRWI